jgi:type VI secretion system protein ImpC
MARGVSFGRLDFKLVGSSEESKGRQHPETPFRILILGDFSGRASQDLLDPGGLARRRPILVDRDNLEEVMAGLGVEIQLSVVGPDCSPVSQRFGELEDFHPDRIFERLEVFQTLKGTRQKLVDPRTFASAAAELRGWGATADQEKAGDRPPEPPSVALEPAGVTAAGLLDEIIETTAGRPPQARPSGGSSEWSAFLQEVVKPQLMRLILHHPDFQAIEAAWRGIHFLVSRLETDAELRLHLLDVSKGELAADLTATEDLRSTGTYKLLVEQTMETPGAEPWAVMAGNYAFDRTTEDAQLLGRMAKIARQTGAPFIAAAHPHLLGCDSLAETPDPDDWRQAVDEAGLAWEALRRLPEAPWVGLTLPRFLLRLPYGRETEPIERFDFEEMSETWNHEHYLWGNPVLASACLLGQAFSRYGWDLRPGVIHDIQGLPLHVYEVQGQSRIKPCAEVVLTERAAEIILDQGLMPLLSLRDRDTVRLARFQSPAKPPTELAGRWSRTN